MEEGQIVNTVGKMALIGHCMHSNGTNNRYRAEERRICILDAHGLESGEVPFIHSHQKEIQWYLCY